MSCGSSFDSNSARILLCGSDRKEALAPYVFGWLPLFGTGGDDAEPVVSGGSRYSDSCL